MPFHEGPCHEGSIHVEICGVIAPFVVISVSYLSISLFVRKEAKQITVALGRSECQVKVR